jgi:two-component system, cell cycle response regulator
MTELKARIVVVDDEFDCADVLIKQLQLMGHRCYAAKNGRQGLELVREHKPDLVMLDMLMPEMNGLEACKAIRSDPELEAIAVLMITGQADEQSKLEALSAGVDDFLPKPAKASEIAARVKTIVSLNRFRKISAEHSRFELAAKLSSEGLLIVNEKEEILFANPAARRLLRLEDQANTFSPSDSTEWVVVGADTANNKGSLLPETASYLSWPATGTAKTCRIQISPIHMAAELPGQALFRVTDISESVENKLNLWGFTTILSHKFKTPLTGVIGNSQLLDIEKDSMNVETRQMVTDLCGSAEQLRETVEEAFSYVDSWHQTVVGEPSQVMAVIGFLTDLAVRQPGITIETSGAGPAAHRELNVAWAVFEACLLELVANSRRFTDNGDSKICVTLGASENELIVEVTDNGSGIPDSEIPLVIRPLYQVDEFHTGEKPGLGLGLSMVNENLKTIGGRLDIRNRSSQRGLVVTSYFPLLNEG